MKLAASSERRNAMQIGLIVLLMFVTAWVVAEIYMIYNVWPN